MHLNEPIIHTMGGSRPRITIQYHRIPKCLVIRLPNFGIHKMCTRIIEQVNGLVVNKTEIMKKERKGKLQKNMNRVSDKSQFGDSVTQVP